MSRIPRDPVDEHLEWLAGRWPSEARKERVRDLSDYPLAKFLVDRHRQFAQRRSARKLKEALRK